MITRESIELLRVKFWEQPYPGSNVHILRGTRVQPRDGMLLDDLIEWLEWRASVTAEENWACHCARVAVMKKAPDVLPRASLGR